MEETCENSKNSVKRLHDTIVPHLDDETPHSPKRTAPGPSLGEETNKLDTSKVAPLASNAGVIVDYLGVPGLFYYPEFVTNEESELLLDSVDAGTWDNSLKRRAQHFGLRYDYTAKSVVKNTSIEALPPFLDAIAERLLSLGEYKTKPDQCIVNGTNRLLYKQIRCAINLYEWLEYVPGQGINPHIDRPDSFGPVVSSLSLNSGVIMKFSLSTREVEVYLEPRSLVMLTGDARYKWKHSYGFFRWAAPLIQFYLQILTFNNTKFQYLPTKIG